MALSIKVPTNNNIGNISSLSLNNVELLLLRFDLVNLIYVCLFGMQMVYMRAKFNLKPGTVRQIDGHGDSYTKYKHLYIKTQIFMIQLKSF